MPSGSKKRKSECTLCKASLLEASSKERMPWQSRASMLRRRGFTISVQNHDKRSDGVTVSYVGALCSGCGAVAVDMLLDHGFLDAKVKGAKIEKGDTMSHTP